jgi:hypothetical protein
MSALRFATDAAGIEFKGATESIKKFLVGLDQARTRENITGDALAKLGIDASGFANGQADVVAILTDLGKRLDMVTSSSERAI